MNGDVESDNVLMEEVCVCGGGLTTSTVTQSVCVPETKAASCVACENVEKVQTDTGTTSLGCGAEERKLVETQTVF